MKENVLDILIHLFENFLDADDDTTPSREALKQELEQVGYPEADIERALAWLESLAADPDRAMNEGAARAVRVFSGHEQVRRASTPPALQAHGQEYSRGACTAGRGAWRGSRERRGRKAVSPPNHHHEDQKSNCMLTLNRRASRIDCGRCHSVGIAGLNVVLMPRTALEFRAL